MSAKNELLSMFDEFVTEEDKRTSEILMMLSNEIIRCRLDMSKTQKEFAEFLEYSQSMISKIESEEYNFTIGTLVNIFSKLGKKLEVSVKSKAQSENNVRTKYRLDSALFSYVGDIYTDDKEKSQAAIGDRFKGKSSETRYC